MYPNPQDRWQSPYAAAATRAGAVPNTLMTRVYQWMALGLGTTGAVAMIVQSSPALLRAVYGTPLIWVLLLATVVMGVALSGFAMRMSAPVAFAVFFLYSAMMGASLAWIFVVYELGSIAQAFFVTAGMFGAMTVYGYVTKRDLSGWGSFLMMGLIGLVIATVVNLVMGMLGHFSSVLYWLITYVGVIVFTGLTAYDTQKIKDAALATGAHGSTQFAIQGATILYLDFVNLFLLLLRVFGSRRE
jgi:FtsH-binding integral membrane protein